jgi:hypothetical protein
MSKMYTQRNTTVHHDRFSQSFENDHFADDAKFDISFIHSTEKNRKFNDVVVHTFTDKQREYLFLRSQCYL